MSFESELIDWLESHISDNAAIEIGIGDDAAVLAADASQSVVTTDLLTDGIDFLVDEVTPAQIGHKSLGVNLSDLAAMAARPIAAFVSLILPCQGSAKHSALELAQGIYEGIIPLANQFDVCIAGGDTNTWDGPLGISITAIGRVTKHGILTRSGGKAGDVLLVTGALGGSILGRHLTVEPRINEVLSLKEKYQLSAGIDISDGLSLDASRLGKASNVGVVLDLDRLPVTDDAIELASRDGRSPLEHALTDGEDFELLFTAAPDEATRILADNQVDVKITRIGELIETPGLWQRQSDQPLSSLEPTGYQHEADI